MSVTITYFVHGTTTDNEKHISSGWKDVDISELGIEQSKELPLLNTTVFDTVFCSDLKRAVHSTELSFKDKYPIVIDKRLRECNYGDYNGESYEDVKERIQSFLNDIKQKYDGKHICIVGHKAPQLALDVLLKDMKI